MRESQTRKNFEVESELECGVIKADHEADHRDQSQDDPKFDLAHDSQLA
jgi:hypothetical protein